MRSGMVTEVEPSNAVTDSRWWVLSTSTSAPCTAAPATFAHAALVRVNVTLAGTSSHVPADRDVNVCWRCSVKLAADSGSLPLFAIAVNRYFAPAIADRLGASTVGAFGVAN